MKTQKIISSETVTIAILLAALMTFTVCSSKDRNSKGEKSQSTVSKKSTKPPSIDIHTATLLGDLEAIRQHIQAGSDLNIKEPSGGASPLITAAVFGKTEAARALIEAGADLNSTNNDGSTPLYCAAFFCRTEIVEALLDKGADKNVINNYGLTALESVAGPFNDVKDIYDIFSKELGPFGFKLDYEQLEVTRPRIAEMFR
jgi:hypothetical protein